MGDAKRVANQAAQMARDFVRETDRVLTDLAGGDLEVIVAAQELVQAMEPHQAQTRRTVEHIAFALLTRAFHQAAEGSSNAQRSQPSMGRHFTKDVDLYRPNG